MWFPQERSANISDTQAYMETLLNFGRLQGPTVPFMHILLFQDTNIEKYEFSEKNIAAFKAEREKLSKAGQIKAAQTVGTETYDGGAKLYVVESSNEGKVLERYWIDVNRGYVCPLIQYYDEKGILLSEYKSRDYFLHEKSGLWFPLIYEEMTTGRDGKQEFKECRIDQSSVDINFSIADDEFAIKIPGGATVADTRKGKEWQRYVATGSGVLSLGKGGLDMEKMKWLRTTEMPHKLQARVVFVRILIIAAGTLLILLGLYRKFARKT